MLCRVITSNGGGAANHPSQGGERVQLHAAVEREMELFVLDSFSFMSVCPKCKDVRYQGGIHGRNCDAFAWFSSEER